MTRKPVARAAVALACAAALMSCGSPPTTTEDATVPETSREPGVPLCGDSQDALRSTGSLTLAGEFPTSASRSATTVEGTVTVTNTGAPMQGDTSPLADVFVVREGRIVATPAPKDLIAQPFDLTTDAEARFPATADLHACAGGGPLPPGTYELYAVVSVVQGVNTVHATGGPYRLDIT